MKTINYYRNNKLVSSQTIPLFFADKLITEQTNYCKDLVAVIGGTAKIEVFQNETMIYSVNY